jgi:hypothetical protein
MLCQWFIRWWNKRHSTFDYQLLVCFFLFNKYRTYSRCINVTPKRKKKQMASMSEYEAMAMAYADDDVGGGGGTLEESSMELVEEPIIVARPLPPTTTTTQRIKTFANAPASSKTNYPKSIAASAPASAASPFVVVRLIQVPRLHNYTNAKGAGVVLKDCRVYLPTDKKTLTYVCFNEQAKEAMTIFTQVASWYRMTGVSIAPQYNNPQFFELKASRNTTIVTVTDESGTIERNAPSSSSSSTTTPKSITQLLMPAPVVPPPIMPADRAWTIVDVLENTMRVKDWKVVTIPSLVAIVVGRSTRIDGVGKASGKPYSKQSLYLLDTSSIETISFTCWAEDIERLVDTIQDKQVVRLTELTVNSFNGELCIQPKPSKTTVRILGHALHEGQEEDEVGEEDTVAALEKHAFDAQQIPASGGWKQLKQDSTNIEASGGGRRKKWPMAPGVTVDACVHDESIRKHKQVRVWGVVVHMDTNPTTLYWTLRCPMCAALIQTKHMNDASIHCSQCDKSFTEGGRLCMSVKAMIADETGQMMVWMQGDVAERLVGCSVDELRTMSPDTIRLCLERIVALKVERWWRLSCPFSSSTSSVKETTMCCWTVHDIQLVDVEREWKRIRMQK